MQTDVALGRFGCRMNADIRLGAPVGDWPPATINALALIPMKLPAIFTGSGGRERTVQVASRGAGIGLIW